MKKIAVIGLGIIGGSLCASLTKAGYTVDGVDLDKNVMKIAKEKGIFAVLPRKFLHMTSC